MLHDALLIAGKDLRIEGRARVTTTQVAPFAGVVLVLFAVAFDADQEVLRRLAAGLFWVAVLFATVLAASRSAAIEREDGARDSLLLSGLDPAGIFIGKATAIAAQLLALESLLLAGVIVLFDVAVHDSALLIVSAVVATLGIASLATLYGVLASSTRNADTLLPLLFLPAAAPVLVCAARAWETALDTSPGGGWGGMTFLGVFAIVYMAAGILAFGPLLEES